MDDNALVLAGIAAAAMMFASGWVLCWVVLVSEPQVSALEKCRKLHNVYACEYVQEARPVQPERTE